MMKWILTCFFIAASFFLTALPVSSSAMAAAPDVPKGDFKDLAETGGGRVADVIDPLTLRLENGTVVSLSGLDYPDLDYYAPGNFTVMTMKILKDFLVGHDVKLYQSRDEGKGRINRMGHQLGHVVRKGDETWIQGLMLSLGLARVRTTKTNAEMAEQMYALEALAREAKTGLWAVQGYQVIPAESASPMIGSFAVIEGKIEKAAMQKNKLYLNFGENYREDFTVGMSVITRRVFTKQNINPQDWIGKKVRVRGWVESYNGPFIEADHPQQFELLFTPAPKEEPVVAPAATEEKPAEFPNATIIKRQR